MHTFKIFEDKKPSNGDMSLRLRSCTDFLKTVLKGSRVQAIAVLVTASQRQLDCLGEIINNLRRLPISSKCKALMRKFKKTLDIIANLTIKTKTRLLTVQRSVKKVLAVLLSAKNRLLTLV